MTTVPRSAEADNRTRSARRAPRRTELAAATTRWLKRGGPSKADLKLVVLGEGPLVVKDFAAKAPWVRCIGRVQISRECRAYRRLGPLPGLPAFFGRIDAHALALQWIDGQELAFLPDRRRDGRVFHARLTEIVRRLHDAGVVHLDLRGKENVIVDHEGRLYVLDLASAFCLRRGNPLGRLLFRWFAVADRAALLKWKAILGAGEFTPEELSFLRRYRFWRTLWVFNRKRRAAKP
jgi:hypothetical protein